jgi:L-amino acid N-acyltransferase YncA
MDNLKIIDSLNNSQIKQLVEYTKSDSDIQRFTMDLERFSSEQSYQRWLERTKAHVFGLIDENENLVGFGWFNKKEFPRVELTATLNPEDYPYTNGIRIYGEARGKGIGSWFYKKILDECPGKTWNLIASENIPSIKLHQKLGFVQVGDSDQNDKILMVR